MCIWHVASLGNMEWENVPFQALFHLSVMVKHSITTMTLVTLVPHGTKNVCISQQPNLSLHGHEM